MADGKIQAAYEVHCAACGEGALGLGNRMDRAIKELRSYGWKLVAGLWQCARCCKRGSK